MPQGKVETIVCIRHGEKPLLGLGQLTPRGLNRALALPEVLLTKFGKPSFIFAPDPNQVANDLGGEFCYVRPLATIEPAAIEYGVPVNTHFGFKDIAGLQQELTKPVYESATIFVAWGAHLSGRFCQSSCGFALCKPGRKDPCGKISAMVSVKVREQDHGTHRGSGSRWN